MNFKRKNRKKANENIFRQKKRRKTVILPEKTRCAPPKTQRVWNWFFRNGTWGKLKMESGTTRGRRPCVVVAGGADSRARHCTGETNGPSLKWQMPPNCHCEERSDVAISGRHSQSVQAAVKTYRPIASVAALTERLVQGIFNRTRALVHRTPP